MPQPIPGTPAKACERCRTSSNVVPHSLSSPHALSAKSFNKQCKFNGFSQNPFHITIQHETYLPEPLKNKSNIKDFGQNLSKSNATSTISAQLPHQPIQRFQHKSSPNLANTNAKSTTSAKPSPNYCSQFHVSSRPKAVALPRSVSTKSRPMKFTNSLPRSNGTSKGAGRCKSQAFRV